MAQLDKIGAKKLRNCILADCNAGLRPSVLCTRCQTYDLQEWIFPQKTDRPLDCVGVPVRPNGSPVNIPWLSIFANFYTCAFCNLVLFGLANDPKFDDLEFSADLSWVDFLLKLTGTVVTDKASEADFGEGLRHSGWLERDKDTLYRPVRNIEFRGVGGKASARSVWFPLGGYPETKNTLLCLRPIMRQQGVLYIDMPKRWLNICNMRHGKQCRPGPWGQIDDTGMYLIDVEDRCIVPVQSQVDYYALSYCWGDISNRSFLTLKKSTIAELSRKGALAENHPLIPTTIEDAILFTKALGCRYLWVDSLCILQDSEKHKQAQINRMDKIYQSANLTIVAAAGGDAWVGLPGVRQTSSPNPSLSRKINNILLYSRTPWEQPKSHIERTDWSSRAWTLQERMLSKRLLIFTPFGLLWECPYTTWEEGIIAESCIHAGTRIEGHGRIKPRETLNPFQKYAWLMETISGKTLSFNGDRLRCMQGMLNQISDHFPGGFFWGMPVAIFGSCLLFDHGLWGEAPFKRCEHFPSWCWAGWIRGARYHVVGPCEGGFSNRMDDNHYLLPAGPVWAVKEVAFFRLDEVSKRWQELPAVQISDEDSAFYDQSKAKWDRDCQVEAIDEIMSRLADANVSPSHVLGFWTQTVFLSVDRNYNPHEYLYKTNHAKDTDTKGFGNSNTWNGYIIRDRAEQAIGSISLTQEYRSCNPDRLRFILIGQNRRWKHDMGVLLDLLHVEVVDEITYRVQGVRDSAIRLETWPLLEPRWEFIVMA